MRGQPLALWFDSKYSDTYSTKILDHNYLQFRRKKNFPHFFNITSMGGKINFKKSFDPSLISFFSEFRLKFGKNKGMILGKFQSGARPGTWSNRQLKLRCKSIIKVCKNKVKTISKFSSFIHYVIRYFYSLRP
jgi:hypothetical protein